MSSTHTPSPSRQLEIKAQRMDKCAKKRRSVCEDLRKESGKVDISQSAGDRLAVDLLEMVKKNEIGGSCSHFVWMSATQLV